MCLEPDAKLSTAEQTALAQSTGASGSSSAHRFAWNSKWRFDLESWKWQLIGDTVPEAEAAPETAQPADCSSDEAAARTLAAISQAPAPKLPMMESKAKFCSEPALCSGLFVFFAACMLLHHAVLCAATIWIAGDVQPKCCRVLKRLGGCGNRRRRCTWRSCCRCGTRACSVAWVPARRGACCCMGPLAPARRTACRFWQRRRTRDSRCVLNTCSFTAAPSWLMSPFSPSTVHTSIYDTLCAASSIFSARN